MLSGVIVCPALMFGTAPGPEVIEAAVDVVLQSAADHNRQRPTMWTAKTGIGPISTTTQAIGCRGD